MSDSPATAGLFFPSEAMAMARGSRPPVPGDSAWPCLRTWGVEGSRLTVSVVPNAKRTEVLGLHDGMLRVRLAAPPVDGKANDTLTAWLAQSLKLPKRGVQLAHGPASRAKVLEIDLPVPTVARWLDQVVPAADADGPLKG